MGAAFCLVLVILAVCIYTGVLFGIWYIICLFVFRLLVNDDIVTIVNYYNEEFVIIGDCSGIRREIHA